MTKRNFDNNDWDDGSLGTFDWLNKPDAEEDPEPETKLNGVILSYEYPADPDNESSDPDFPVHMKRDSEEFGLSIIRCPLLHREMYLLVFLDESIDKNPNPDETIYEYFRLHKFGTYEEAEAYANHLISEWKHSRIVETDVKGKIWEISAAELVISGLRSATKQPAINFN